MEAHYPRAINTVGEYPLKARNGRHIRMATVAIVEGQVVHFTERLTHSEAIRQAEALLANGYREA